MVVTPEVDLAGLVQLIAMEDEVTVPTAKLLTGVVGAVVHSTTSDFLLNPRSSSPRFLPSRTWEGRGWVNEKFKNIICRVGMPGSRPWKQVI